MKKGNLVKKIMAGAMAVSLLALSGQHVYADSAGMASVESENIIDSLEDEINIEVNENEITYDEEDIYERIDSLDIDSINRAYIECGLKPVSSEELAEIFISGIESVNEELNDGELKMLSDGTMVESEDDSFYLQGGSTYDKTYWWGKRRYKSTAAANKWVQRLNRTAAGEAAAGVIFGGAPRVAAGLCSAYCWYLATDVAYYNSLSNRGIKADIPWSLVGYKIRKQ